MTAQLAEHVQQLRTLSPKLNEAASEAAAVVRSVEKFLGDECSLGIEAEVLVEAYNRTKKVTEYRSLAYARAEKKFCIVVRDERATEGVNDRRIPVTSWKTTDTPWLSADRAAKLETFLKLPELLKALSSKAAKAIQQTGEAATASTALLEAMGKKALRLISFDDALMYSAVGSVKHVVGSECVGFLDIHTGEILFTMEDESSDPEEHGLTAEESAANRRKVEADRGRYIEIPKYPYPGPGKPDTTEQHIEDFLAEHGLRWQ